MVDMVAQGPVESDTTTEMLDADVPTLPVVEELPKLFITTNCPLVTGTAKRLPPRPAKPIISVERKKKCL
jgi:hypothetical protein